MRVFATLFALLALSSLSLSGQDVPQGRLPEPGAEAQKQAEKEIRELLKEDYAQTSSDARRTLARKLLTLAHETRDDPVARYVLCREAGEIAAQAGDPALALSAIREMSLRYAVDVTGRIMALLESVVKKAKEPPEAGSAAELGLAVADEVMSVGDLDAAGRAAELADSLARKAGDFSVVARADAKVKEIAECRPRYDGVKKALERLAADPEDSDSHLLVGRFKCLVRGDWKGGLSHLAKGLDPALKAQASKDLAGPAEAAMMLAVADGWWALSENESGLERTGMRRRASFWYEKALPSLAGLSKIRAENRLAGAKPKPIAKEYVIFAEDISGSGAMKLVKHPELTSCWKCEEDVTDPAKARETYVQFEFPALEGTPYLCWVYAGACCLETFTVYMQATDMTGPNPRKPSERIPYDVGGPVAAPVEPRVKGLNKTHALHGGEKQSSRWDWVPIPLPKYATGGLKKVRLLTEQKGFTVALALVSPLRQTPPKDEELWKLFRGRR